MELSERQLTLLQACLNYTADRMNSSETVRKLIEAVPEVVREEGGPLTAKEIENFAFNLAEECDRQAGL